MSERINMEDYANRIGVLEEAPVGRHDAGTSQPPVETCGSIMKLVVREVVGSAVEGWSDSLKFLGRAGLRHLGHNTDLSESLVQ